MDDEIRNRIEDPYQRCFNADYGIHTCKSKGEVLRFQIGDMVTTSKDCKSFGLIVRIDKANAKALGSSQHSASLINNAHDIYYVLFSSAEISGPYYNSELISWN